VAEYCVGNTFSNHHRTATNEV